MNICSMASEHMFKRQRTYVHWHLNLCSRVCPSIHNLAVKYVWVQGSNAGRTFQKQKSTDNLAIISAFSSVGMTGFEPATTRPPDAYSNRTELHPDWAFL